MFLFLQIYAYSGLNKIVQKDKNAYCFSTNLTLVSKLYPSLHHYQDVALSDLDDYYKKTDLALKVSCGDGSQVTATSCSEDHTNNPYYCQRSVSRNQHLNMLVLLIFTFYKVTAADLTLNDVQYLNELPLDKLLRMKSSLQELVTASYDNVTATPAYTKFGAQALALNAPIKRADYELKKGGQSKLGTLFSMSITTLAFLAFGGYLLCLIVQAVKAKESQNTATVAPAFFLSAGIKKKPQPQFSASYGRQRRATELSNVPDIRPEQLFDAMLRFCEGYAKWSQVDEGGH